MVTRKRHSVNVGNTLYSLLNVDFKEFCACKVIFYCCANIYIVLIQVLSEKTFEGEVWLAGSGRSAADTGKLWERWGTENGW